MILVTGASGHLGSRVVQMLHHQGHPVIGISHTKILPGIESVDLTDQLSVVDFCQRNQVTACVHCAAIMSSASEILPVKDTISVNNIATSNLLSYPWQRFIYVSSGSVFQDAHKTITEDTEPSPKSIYALTKRLAEIDTVRNRGIVARVSWLYGPPITSESQNPARGPIPWIINEFKKNQPSITIPGGDHCASFTYVDDVAKALSLLITANQLKHDTYHIGTGQNHSVQDIVEMLQPYTKVVADIEPGTAPWSRVTRPRPPMSIDRISKELGWQPQWTLNQGLKEYWKIYG